jgi:phage/plasmid-associated DNA primase
VTVPLTAPYRGTTREIPRHVLDARLSGESSGLLNLALNALERFQANGNRYSIGDSMMESFEEFREVTDPLAIWLERSTELSPDGVIGKRDLYSMYKAWAEQQRQPLMTIRTFGTSLQELRPTVRESQRRVEGKPTEVWLGLELKRVPLDTAYAV